jgi:hypothetical protein
VGRKEGLDDLITAFDRALHEDHPNPERAPRGLRRYRRVEEYNHWCRVQLLRCKSPIFGYHRAGALAIRVRKVLPYVEGEGWQ